jgi:pilus assembly protein TadC
MRCRVWAMQLNYWNSKIFGYAILSTLLLTVCAFIAVLLRQKDFGAMTFREFGAQMYPFCQVIAGFMTIVAILSLGAKVVSWVFERRARQREKKALELMRDVLQDQSAVGKQA